MKDAVTKMKNTLEGINSRVDEGKDQVHSLEDKKAENNQSEQKKRIPKNEDNLKSLWDNFKHTNICIMGVAEGEEREQGIENLF